MKDTSYAFCVARIRAVENKLLGKQDISALINSKDLSSAMDYLSQKGYSCNDESIDSVVNSEGDKLFRFLSDSVPDTKELDTLYILNDYFNIKAIVKGAIEGENPLDNFIYPTTITFCNKSYTTAEEYFSSLDSTHKKCALEAYEVAIKSGNGRYCDVIIDKAAIDKLASIYKSKNSGLAGEIAAFLADTANLKNALRCIATNQEPDFIRNSIGSCCKIDRQHLVDVTISGEDALYNYLMTSVYNQGVTVYRNKPSDFEKWCDDEIIKKVKSTIYTSFGFAPVISYYYRKNLEIKTVRMILTAIKSGIDKQLISERVRNIYA